MEELKEIKNKMKKTKKKQQRKRTKELKSNGNISKQNNGNIIELKGKLKKTHNSIKCN